MGNPLPQKEIQTQNGISLSGSKMYTKERHDTRPTRPVFDMISGFRHGFVWGPCTNGSLLYSTDLQPGSTHPRCREKGLGFKVPDLWWRSCNTSVGPVFFFLGVAARLSSATVSFPFV